ncbi:Iron-regulated protein A precursor [Roseivivax jejudonensis]|uniref:Iron-regulated protein A n=1 Tax=Roseivivax jejudonensis TaxID=1529041 RepID=A0A1X6YUV7_9RHOB|nr:imelysin family protein [Roseivivax jejudonensis]SLN32067.1 Iron-regulated protein A precursor [Roseivivax jejudonensis]
MRRALVATLCLIAGPAVAGVDAALDEHVLPGTARFAERAAAFEDAAQEDCSAEALRPAYHDAFDAWLGIAHLGLGPLEDGGRGLAIAFWPDTRGMVDRTVRRLVADEDPATSDADAFAEVSVAGRGLFAAERLLFDADYAGYAEGDYTCSLVRAVAKDLSRMAAAVASEWREDFAPLMREAGSDGNTRFLSEREAAQALFTTLVTGLEFVADRRLGVPMGSFDAPRPQMAEARRSGRSLRNVVGYLEALKELARTLSDAPIPQTEAAFAQALETARELEDPVFAGVETPVGRLRVEALQTEVDAITQAVGSEIAPALGVSVGFNSADGD